MDGLPRTCALPSPFITGLWLLMAFAIHSSHPTRSAKYNAVSNRRFVRKKELLNFERIKLNDGFEIPQSLFQATKERKKVR